MVEWGLFNDDSADFSLEEAVEADFESYEAAAQAMAERYSTEDDLVIHEVEDTEGCAECNEEGDEAENLDE